MLGPEYRWVLTKLIPKDDPICQWIVKVSNAARRADMDEGAGELYGSFAPSSFIRLSRARIVNRERWAKWCAQSTIHIDEEGDYKR